MIQKIQKDQSTASLQRMAFDAQLSANRNETHRVNLGDINTGDTFTMTFDGQTTAAIAYNATPATQASNIDTAYEALSNIDTVTVVHVTGATFDITYTGTHAGLSLNLPTITPTGFTPGAITRQVTGGVSGAPALGETFSTSELRISKNGAAFVSSAGTVTESGEGAYYYNPTVGEIDTEGYFLISILKSGLASQHFLYTIEPVSTVNGETVIATGLAQVVADAGLIRLASGTTVDSNYVIPCRVDITAGTGAGQGGRLGFAYNSGTKDLSVEPPWVTLPDATSQYKLTSVVPSPFDQFRTNHQIANTFGGDLSSPADIIDEFLSRYDEFSLSMLNMADGVETGLTLRQHFRLVSAFAAGKLSGAGTSTETIRNFGDTKNRIVATVDASGNRSAITTDLT